MFNDSEMNTLAKLHMYIYIATVASMAMYTYINNEILNGEDCKKMKVIHFFIF